jgi:hypothetical protein
VDLSMLLCLEDILRDREGVETRRGVVNCGISGMLLQRIQPSYWSNLSGSGLGLNYFPFISMSTSHNMSNYTKNRT